MHDHIESSPVVRLKRLRIAVAILAFMAFIAMVVPASADGVTHISGTLTLDVNDDCDAAAVGATYDRVLTGDLEGCIYFFVESLQCNPSGTYIETGTELYVVESSDGKVGTFGTTYRFTGKFVDCSTYQGQIFGRCQHPVAAGSGTGDFEGVTGRLDYKDDVDGGFATMRGHLAW